jgi:hypothetical protein
LKDHGSRLKEVLNGFFECKVNMPDSINLFAKRWWPLWPTSVPIPNRPMIKLHAEYHLKNNG